MFTKKRPDGTYIKNLHFFTQLLPYLMPTRADACIFFEQEFDLSKTLEYVRKKRAAVSGNFKISVFYLILYATTRAIAQRPKINRFVSGCRYYQRNRISYNFVAKRELSDEGEEVNVTMSFSPFLSLEAFCKKIDDHLASLKKGEGTSAEKVNNLVARLPRALIKFAMWGLMFLDRHNGLPKSVIDSLPFFSTVFFTNVGSVGIDAPFHHNFEIGNCGIFCAIGKIRKERSIAPDGSIETHDKVKITFTYDDRITDGIYCARTLDMIRDMVENPEKLEAQLELTQEQLANLGLADSELSVEKVAPNNV
jgi:hypothetical protein